MYWSNLANRIELVFTGVSNSTTTKSVMMVQEKHVDKQTLTFSRFYFKCSTCTCGTSWDVGALSVPNHEKNTLELQL